MDFSGIARRVGKFASDNSPTILTAVAVAGTVTTAYLTGKASFKAAQIIDDKENEFDSNHSDYDTHRLEPREIVQLCWRLYIPAATSLGLTIASIIAINQIGSKRIAALTAAYAISEKAFDEYKHKVVEKVGEKKERSFRDEIAQDRINRRPPPEDMVLLQDDMSVLCCDLFSGRYFLSDMETLRRAENDINYRINHDYYASLSNFYELVGLPKTSMSDDFGWNADKLLELHFSTAMTPSGKPCLTFDFRVLPIRGFSRLQ